MTTGEQLEEWFVVFDEQDLHPVTGESMGGCYLPMECPDRDAVRREACRRFGDQWATLVLAADARNDPTFAHELLHEYLATGAFGEQGLDFERTFGPTYDGRR